MSTHWANCRKKGVISVWVGSFPSVDAAEAYFGIPDEIGVCLPPEAFARDLRLDEIPPDCLEVNFEQLSAHPLHELLKDATFSASFANQAVEAASRHGIQTAQGIALLYDFDYQARADWQRVAGPLTFIGSFPIVGTAEEHDARPRRDGRIGIREIVDDVL